MTKTKVLAVIISANAPMTKCLSAVRNQGIEVLVNVMEPKHYHSNPIHNKYENCCRNRNAARERALKSTATHFLFLDDDIVIPDGAVKRLIANKKQIVGGWYPILGTDRFVCGRWVGDNLFLNYIAVERDLIMTDVVGLGCTMMAREVLEKIPFEPGTDKICTAALTKEALLLGECGVFGNRAFEFGYPMFMDGSVVCEHLNRSASPSTEIPAKPDQQLNLSAKTKNETNNNMEVQHQQTESPQTPQPRLPQIDPVTFSALNMLDGFVGKAPLTRQEHADANKSMQHIVQTIEILQATVRELTNQSNGLRKAIEGNGHGPSVNRGIPATGAAVVAEVAEEVFKKSCVVQ